MSLFFSLQWFLPFFECMSVILLRIIIAVLPLLHSIIILMLLLFIGLKFIFRILRKIRQTPDVVTLSLHFEKLFNTYAAMVILFVI